MNYKRLTFSRLIRRNEFRELTGRRYQTLLFLSAILYVTFLCFGFSRSAFNLVNNLSKDPLSNWINIKFTGNTAYQLQQLNKELSEEEFREGFIIKNADFYGIFGMSFLNSSFKKGLSYRSRTIDPNSPIVEDLVNERNLVKKFTPETVTQAFKMMPEGIIVTEELIHKLGFSGQDMRYLYWVDNDEIFPSPIIAIVNDLPDAVDAICSNAFYCSMVKTFPPQNEFVLDLVVEKVNNQQFINIMLDISKELEYEDISYFSTDTIEVISDSLITWSLKIPDEGLSISKQEKLSRIQDLPSLQGVHYGPFYDYEIDTNCNSEGHYHDYLAVEFEQLDKIRNFSSYIKDEFGVSMNMETLIQRENYLFVGNLAIAAILMVIVFSIFSLTLYISETFKNHILKVKKNLGNLMALGASNNELISLYLRVAFRMLLYAILIAFAIGYVSGELFEKYILGNLMVLQEGENYFSLLNSWLGLFIFLIISIALLMTFVTIKRILKVSPGDLIYERDHAKIEQNLKRNEGS